MPHNHYKQVKSPQAWRKRSIRKTPKRTEQKTAKAIKKKFESSLKKTWIKRLTLLAVFGILAGLIFGSIAIAWFSRDLPEPGGIIQRDVPLSTKIYDRTGTTLLYEVFEEEKRTPIHLEELPRDVVWATLVAEDRGFYSHAGIKLTSIVRAVISNVLRGGRGQGGSTITQQLIKNAFLSTEKTYTRKIKEAILAWQIERKFSKDEILEMYFNEIPYGSTYYGIEAAAQGYFGKSAKDLTIAQAALLSSIPKAATYYSPYGPNRDALIGRQHFIIRAMEDEGYITHDEAEAALVEELNFLPPNTSITAPHFVFYVRDLLSQKYGERALEQGGLTVITTIDLFKQKIAEDIISERGENNSANYNANNAAMVAMDPKTGEILTMVGSRDFFNDDIDGKVNVALRPRQPGSSFKPIVFTASFEQGLSPETILFDLDTVFKTEIGEDYEPKNYNLSQNGPVSIRQALGSSLNTPAVKAIYLTGVDNVLNLAEKLGYTTLDDRSRFGLSLVLGGAEVKLLEHVAAYGALAREGVYQKPVAILRIEDKDGRVLEEFDRNKINKEPVIDPQIVKQINSVLSDNSARLLTFGENNYLTLGARPVAAKTGTTNDYRDAWTIGYTPSLVAGVWVGNNDNSAMKNHAAGGTVAAPIWNAFMSQVLGDTPIETFKEPEPYTLPNKPMLNGNQALENKVKIDRTTGKLATDFTPKVNIEERTYMEVHNILHYVNKNNILGPIPESPWDDPNYTTWELPVEEWAKENNIIIGTPPTSFDDVHKAEDQPTILLQSPNSNTTLSDLSLTVQVSAEAPRGINRIEYYIDNEFISSQPFNQDRVIENHTTTLTLPNKFANGVHLFSAIIYDSLSNDAETQSNINIQIANNPIINDVITFSQPAQNQQLATSDFPFTAVVDIADFEKVKKIDFYLLDTIDNSTEKIFTTTDIAKQISFEIGIAPSPGLYSLYSITTNTKNQLNLDNNVFISVK